MWSYFENKQLYWLLLTLSLGKTVWIWESVTIVPAKSLSLLFQSLSVWLVRGYAAAEAMWIDDQSDLCTTWCQNTFYQIEIIWFDQL